MKPKRLSNWEWVALARSSSEPRPWGCGIYVSEEQLVATDGHRLHVAPNDTQLKPGLTYDPKTLRPVDGQIPNYAQVLEPVPAQMVWSSGDSDDHPDKLDALVKALMAGEKARRGFLVSWPTPSGRAHVNPLYLSDILKGRHVAEGDWGPVYVHQEHGQSPVHFQFEYGGRRAVLMPVRVASEEHWSHFALDRVVELGDVSLEKAS